MRLTRLFLLTTTLLLSGVTALLLRAAWADWQMLDNAEQGLGAMQRARLAMQVAEKASAERGPAIPVLNDREPADPARRVRLSEFRAITDAAFDTALEGLAGSTEPAAVSARAQLAQARTELSRARDEVDRVAALPHAHRSAPGQRLTRGPIDQMFGVIDTVMGGVTTLSAAAEAAYPALAGPLMGARHAAELREVAGRLGSQFTTPLATQTVLGPDEQREVALLEGRLQQLRRLITLQARVGRADEATQAAIARMEAEYFGQGLPFAQEVAQVGLTSPSHGLDSADFVARYVPPMASIVALRDTLFTTAREAATAQVGEARLRLAVNSVLGGALLAVEVGVFLLIRRRVLRPLLHATESMAAIMQGRPLPPQAATAATRRDEIGEMQRAVSALHEATQRRRALEAERKQLVERLRVASDTDFLTGLPNRRAFTERALGLLAQARRHNWPVALIVFDLDRFKQINDQHGHQVGDEVLQATADIARAQVRGGELLARHGGEEFAVLAPDCRADEARLLAERLRAALAAVPINGIAGTAGTGAPAGLAQTITASFGLACASARDVASLDELFREADRALYTAKATGRNRVAESTPLR
jgi:diguanylate cyclase (GGDEF)-like protein